jgi:hypothetical protein
LLAYSQAALQHDEPLQRLAKDLVCLRSPANLIEQRLLYPRQRRVHRALPFPELRQAALTL